MKTQSGLRSSHFKVLTDIQSRAIGPALKGGDILGAAKTGSGKTLAFLVPVLENLFRKRWTTEDGLGALILSPTRELAIQIFEVLRKVGRNHNFSAGLIIGGKNLKEERARMGRMNILVATPGRMLQHMDQTSELEMANLQILVLDEADRIMDMGFKDTVDAMVEHLPPDRQTLLFSATQTKRVSDLARLSLRNPQFVAVHEAAESATPATLQQNYIVVPLWEKFDTLWSFVRANVKKKILVFLSSGKQVRYAYEALRHLQPGIPLLHVHGRQKQTARMDITTRFSNSQHACLFATDIAARGLDFPAVDWVVQVDCPEDADTYIHRVGRTARYEHEGRAVLFLDPSEEEGMLKALERKKVFLERINVREKKMQSPIRNQLQNLCFHDPELKYLGQKAFISYVKSVHLQKDKDIFDVKGLDLEQYATSLGLPGTPKVKYVKGDDAKRRKNAPRQLADASSSDEAEAPMHEKNVAVRTKYDRMFERQNQDVLAQHYTKMIGDDNEQRQIDGHDLNPDADEEHDFLSVKRRFDAGDQALGADVRFPKDSEKEAEDCEDATKEREGIMNRTVQLSSKPNDALIVDSKRREKLLKSRKKLLKFKGKGDHLHFDEQGQPHEKVYYEKEEEFTRKGEPEEQRERFVQEELEKSKATDVLDKAEAKRKRRVKREKLKARERDAIGDGSEDEDPSALLVPYEDEIDASEFPPKDKPAKRAKKWFEDASSDEEKVNKNQRKAGRDYDAHDLPETLEDLEALASGLIAT